MTVEELHTILEYAQRYMTNNREAGFDEYIKLNGMLILSCEKLLDKKAREVGGENETN